MKKVILQANKIEVYLDDLHNLSIVGCQSIGSDRFALSRTEYGFEFVGNINLSYTSKIQYKTLHDALQRGGDFFVFETTKELFKWMSE